MAWRVCFGEITWTEAVNPLNGETVMYGHSDQEVDLDEFAPEVFEKIAQELSSGYTDSGVWLFPRDSTSSAYAVVRVAAERLGIDPPPKPTKMPEAAAIKSMIVPAEDAAEEPMMGGFPPKEPTSGSSSSSTAPELTDGLDTSPEDTPSNG